LSEYNEAKHIARAVEAVTGIVFDIQRYSVHDGPGLRTNVFLKGCPLRCGWCANPESQQPHPELVIFKDRCMNCGQFDSTCSDARTKQNGTRSSAHTRETFQPRVDLCPVEAVQLIGKVRTAASVMEEVRRDKPFYGGGGGLTLTGGEPTMQPDFAEALLKLAQVEGISTAIETCGHTPWSVYERLLPFLDSVLFDLKHIDSAIHQQYTGVDNALILANLRQLATNNAPVTVRIPLIPGFNATANTLKAMGNFILEELNGAITQVDLLPYHNLGKNKYDALGRDYPWDDQRRLTDDEVEHLANALREMGLNVRLGG
jgi:pyruvate formate lyase activating enzyme